MSQFLRRSAFVCAAGIALVGLGTVPAYASNGTAYTSDTGDIAGRTYFNDDGDIYTVYDMDNDYEGVVGWIAVKQADGSYKNFARVYVGSGNNTSKGNNVDITRESATVKIVACRQNGPDGTPYDCGVAYTQGS